MSLPIIDEESSDVDLPPPTSPPPSYESLQFPRTTLRLHVSPPPPSSPNRHHREYYFGVTTRTFILLFSLASCLINTLIFLVGNGFLAFQVSEMCLVASWIIHIFILTAAGLRNQSLITYLADWLKYVVYTLVICIISMFLAIVVIFAIIGKEMFMTNIFQFLTLGGYVVFLCAFTIQLIVHVVFVIDLYNELANVAAPRTFY